MPPETLDEFDRQLDPRQPINIQYTSGTTGFPKAATLSHRNLLLNAYYVGMCQAFTADDRICIPVPFYHCFGCVLGTLTAVVYGAAMIVPAESFQCRRPRSTPSRKNGPPRSTACRRCSSPSCRIPSLAGRDLTSLRTGIMAGSPCPIEVMRQVIDRMGAREITIGYGQTEASPIITQSRNTDPLELRVETVGRPLPGVEVKIVDPATRQERWATTSRASCAPAATASCSATTTIPKPPHAAIDADGWLHTGDLALRLPNGYYRITGRIKDMVIRGGENIYPREIEEFLFTHPAIEQAAVVGVPDKKYVEELCAWIKLKAGCSCDRGRDPRVLPRQAGPLQGAALRQIRRDLSADRDRQDPEIQDPRTDDRRARPGRAGNGIAQRCLFAASIGPSPLRPVDSAPNRDLHAEPHDAVESVAVGVDEIARLANRDAGDDRQAAAVG